jgi:hypothetical protein
LIGLRHHIDAKSPVRKNPKHDQGQGHHDGEYGPMSTDVRYLH